jgi:HEAT repeat protein
MSHDDYSDQAVGLLLDKLNGRTEIVRMGVIRKLSHSPIAFERWSLKLPPLLADENRLVRVEALDAVASHASELTPELVVSLRSMLGRPNEHLDLRLRAWILLRQLRRSMASRSL